MTAPPVLETPLLPQATTPRGRTRRGLLGHSPALDGLRGLALILVLVYHFTGVGGPLPGGWSGVDIFFVLSGFLITALLLDERRLHGRVALARFYARRGLRLLPALFVMLGVWVVLLLIFHDSTWIAATPNNGKRGGPVDVLPALAHVGLVLTYGINWLHALWHGYAPLGHLWSLAVEEQFYFVYPLLVFLAAAVAGPRHRRRVLTVALTALVGASAWWSVHLTAVEPAVAYYSPFTRFWELGLGCLLAVVTAGRPPIRAWLGAVGSLLGAALIVASLVVLHNGSAYPGSLAWLPCGGAALLLLGGSSGRGGGVSGLLSLAPLVYIGDLSYSLYLTHYAWLNLPADLATPLTGWGWRAVELLGTAVTAALSYHLLENPIRRSTRLAGDRVAVALLLVACVGASWAAAAAAGHLLI